MLAEFGTDKAKQTALLGGGGSKAQNERAAALAAILAASIVDAASASVHGRSVAAAKAASSDKTAILVAMHMAGERAPVIAKMVKNVSQLVLLHHPLFPPIMIWTCENFITLCECGYYNGVAFHRNIRYGANCGDPTGTGRGGESIWRKPFNDELNSKLLHSGRGVVSMANSGPHTNGSQFFILYKSANHLNFKHTVFGGVVGGLTTLSVMEKVPVDDNDKPLEIKIISVTVFVNPYSEPDEEEEQW
ncbi:hypothetical protein GQ457_05G007790 [Hibiscus cannabinus]